MTVVRRDGAGTATPHALCGPVCRPLSTVSGCLCQNPPLYAVGLSASFLPEEASDVSFAMAACSSALSYDVTLTQHMG
jgi:hypothetical protein